jgi:hypothetical protein
MQCVSRWTLGAKTTGFCFRVIAAGAIVFVSRCSLRIFLSSRRGRMSATIARPDHRYKTNLYTCWVFPKRNSGERRLALAVADDLG